jgi:hypothetical protein
MLCNTYGNDLYCQSARLSLPLRQRGTAAAFAVVALMAPSSGSAAPTASPHDVPILKRHVDRERSGATQRPRSEQDQAVVAGWPLYRTERGQEAFNQTMATLQATAGPAPTADHFEGCARLRCQLRLPAMTRDGWLPSGRLWLSANDYMLIVRSPRGDSSNYKRRARRHMRVFVFHEFHNATRNTDVYDTISSHSGRVFTPFYLSKPRQDGDGKQFVVLVQVAPYDVVSRHAANHGNLGPGIEVAKNRDEVLAPLQAKAGVITAEFMKQAVPRIRVVRHRGAEGLGLLQAYLDFRKSRNNQRVQLPFTKAKLVKISSAQAHLSQLVGDDRKPPRPVQLIQRDLTPPSPILVSKDSDRLASVARDREDLVFLQARDFRSAHHPPADVSGLLRHLAALAQNVRW